MTTHKVDGPLTADKFQGGGRRRDQDIQITLKIGPTFHGADRNNHLLAVIPFTLHLHDRNLPILCLGLENRGLYQEPVAGLNPTGRTIDCTIVVCTGTVRIPSHFLSLSTKATAPEMFLLNVTTSNHRSHYKSYFSCRSELSFK